MPKHFSQQSPDESVSSSDQDESTAAQNTQEEEEERGLLLPRTTLQNSAVLQIAALERLESERNTQETFGRPEVPLPSAVQRAVLPSSLSESLPLGCSATCQALVGMPAHPPEGRRFFTSEERKQRTLDILNAALDIVADEDFPEDEFGGSS